MKQVMLELSDDLARQVGSYQGRLQELVLLGLSQLKAQVASRFILAGSSPSHVWLRSPVFPAPR